MFFPLSTKKLETNAAGDGFFFVGICCSVGR
jgi:hypothetical protein